MVNPPKGYGEERYVVVIRKFAEVDGWCDHAEMPKAPAEFLGPVSHDSGDGRESAVRNELIEEGRILRAEVGQERPEKNMRGLGRDVVG